MDVAGVKALMAGLEIGSPTTSNFVTYIGTWILHRATIKGGEKYGVVLPDDIPANDIRRDRNVLPEIIELNDVALVTRFPIRIYGKDFRVHLSNVIVPIPLQMVADLLTEMGRADIDDTAPEEYLSGPKPANVFDWIGDLLPTELKNYMTGGNGSSPGKETVTYALLPIDERRSEVILTHHRVTLPVADVLKRHRLWSDWKDLSYLTSHKKFFGEVE